MGFNFTEDWGSGLTHRIANATTPQWVHPFESDVFRHLNAKNYNMTARENLLICLIEEQAEVIQRLCKNLRFGDKEVQPGQTLNNNQRLAMEMGDATGLLDFIAETEVIEVDPTANALFDEHVAKKKDRYLKYLEYSRSLGIVTD